MSVPYAEVSWSDQSSSHLSWLASIVGLALAALGMDLASDWLEKRQDKKKLIAETLKSRENVGSAKLKVALEYALSLGDHASAAEITEMMVAELS